jgi:hypothetical protein
VRPPSVTAENGVDLQDVPARDRRSWSILVRRARGCEGAKPPCQCRAPSGAHIKKLGRRPALMGGAQRGRPKVVTAGSSADAREAVPSRLQRSFEAGAAAWQNEARRS